MVNIPKALILYSSDGDHAGFMLVDAEEGGASGNCVFMLSPVSAEGIESDLGVVVSDLKVAGEHRFVSSESGGAIELAVHPKGLPVVRLCLDADFAGTVHTEFDGVERCIGEAVPAKRPNA